MLVKIFKDGQEIDMQNLSEKEFEQVNQTYLNLLLKTVLSKLKKPEPIQPLLLNPGDEDASQNLFQEEVSEAQCTGNPDDCPVCGESYHVDFADALKVLKEGGKVTRKSWLGLDVEYLYLTEENEYVYPSFFIKDLDGKSYTYTFQHDDLTAEDWLLIDN